MTPRVRHLLQPPTAPLQPPALLATGLPIRREAAAAAVEEVEVEEVEEEEEVEEVEVEEVVEVEVVVVVVVLGLLAIARWGLARSTRWSKNSEPVRRSDRSVPNGCHLRVP
jgi:hypothetical protein